MAEGQKSRVEQDGVKPEAEVFRVGVRVPPFYPEKPSLWFNQMEAQFMLAGIKSDETKFYYVTGNLETQYASEVDDIIENPPPTGKYEKLKTELVKRLSASREKKVKQLLTHEELGDRKPSQFYRHLLNLAGPGVPEEFFRSIWSSRLPASTQAIVASQTRMDLAELAELADRIHDVVGTQVASITTAESDGHRSSISPEIAALTRQVERLSEKLERLSGAGGRSRSRTHHRSRSASRSTSNYGK